MVYIFYGPTGSGKTDLAIAQILKNRQNTKKDAEVILADSRQIYIGMDIGTNKDKKKYTDNDIKYHLADILTPDKKFSVWQWNRLAKEKIQEISNRGNDIYIVGGTGLYLDSLLYPREYLSITSNEKLSEESNNDKESFNDLSLNNIQEIFVKDFPKDYEKLNESERLNKRRLINNYLKLKNINNLNKGNEREVKENNFVLEKGSYKLITPKYSRGELYERINKRVDKMFEEGFIEEVKELIEKGYKDSEAMKGSGYGEIVKYITNSKESEEQLNKVKDEIKKSHRNYAKRQITWFKKYYYDI